MGIGLALAGQVWHTSVQREKEKELRFVGEQFRKAIARYYEDSPGGAKKFPTSLEDLLDDKRYPTTRRHLRRIYPDPMTGLPDWGFVTAQDGAIMGVYSMSEGVPRKVWGFAEHEESFTGAKIYSDWKFVHSAVVADDHAPPAVPSPDGGVPPGIDPSAPSQPAAPTPVPSAPPKDDPRRKQICDSMLRLDLGSCTMVRSNAGDDAGTQCERSAQQRHAACMNAEPMPPLAIPNP